MKVLSIDVVFDENLEAKDDESEEVHTKVSLSKEEPFLVNQAKVEQAPVEQVHAEPTSITLSRLRRAMKPS